MAIDTVAMRNALAAEYAAQATHASLHSSDPGATGANEIAGVARKPITWSAPSNGAITAQVVFNVTAGASVGGGGVWDALTGGAFKDGGALTVQAFSADGTYTLNLSYTQS